MRHPGAAGGLPGAAHAQWRPYRPLCDPCAFDLLGRAKQLCRSHGTHGVRDALSSRFTRAQLSAGGRANSKSLSVHQFSLNINTVQLLAITKQVPPQYENTSKVLGETHD